MAGLKAERENCPETSANFSSFGEFSAPRHYKGVLWCSRPQLTQSVKAGELTGECCTPPRGEAKQSCPLHVTVWRNLLAGNAVESQSGSVTIIPDYRRHDDKTIIKDTGRQTDRRAQIKCLTISNETKTPFPPVGFCPFLLHLFLRFIGRFVEKIEWEGLGFPFPPPSPYIYVYLKVNIRFSKGKRASC